MAGIEAQRDGGMVALRPPDSVMRLDRLGSAFQTRLSFMRSLIRRMSRERWRIERSRFDLDENGYGRVVYTATAPERRSKLLSYILPEIRVELRPGGTNEGRSRKHPLFATRSVCMARAG